MIIPIIDKAGATWWMATNKAGAAVIGRREHEVRVVANLAKAEPAYRIFDVTSDRQLEINQTYHGNVTWLDDPEE